MSISFIKHWLSSPRSVGAILPSSKFLARAMSELAVGADCVVELGAGTGAITDELAKMHGEQNLVIYEPSQDLSKNLKQKFPLAKIIASPLHANIDAIKGLPKNSIMVSSIPFRSLSSKDKKLTIDVIVDFLLESQSRRLIQFSYHPRSPFESPVGYHWDFKKAVLFNTPPAGVWELHADHRQGSSMTKVGKKF